MTQRVSNEQVWHALHGAGVALLDLARGIVVMLATVVRVIAEVLAVVVKIVIRLAREIVQVLIVGEVIGAALFAGGAVWAAYPGGVEKLILLALLTITPIAYALKHPQRIGALQAAAIVLVVIGAAVDVFDIVGRVALLLIVLSVAIIHSQKQTQQETELNHATDIRQIKSCLPECDQVGPGGLHGDPVDRPGHVHHAGLD